jgi:16S rRNA (uracil1498-N3)-methyltransferase
MPGHRFFSSFQTTDQKVILKDADECQHLIKVLRLKKGDDLELINGQGGLARAVVDDVAKASVAMSLREVVFVPRALRPRITLACAIPKRSKFETIIEKATELGVDRIIPLVTERTEFVADGEKIEKKTERFERVAMNAAKQCKRIWFPEISPPVALTQALKQCATPDTGLFIPWLEGDRVSLREAFTRKLEAKEFVFFIGPEGDFTPEEVKQALKAGALAVSLGENVLKVDTAAMAVVAFAVQMLGNKGAHVR